MQSKLQRKGMERACVSNPAPSLAACLVLVLFALLVLPLSMAFTGELSTELWGAAGRQGGAGDGITSCLSINCVLKKGWPDL